MKHSTIDMPQAGDDRRFTSLRTKFIVFISLIIVGVCSALSWYVVRQQSEFMAQTLQKTGLMLVTNLAHNSRYPLLAHDSVSLERLVDGAMKAEEVVYVVMTSQEGKPLASQTKGIGPSVDPEPANPFPLYPDSRIAQSLLVAPAAEPLITLFTHEGSNLRNNTQQDGKPGLPFRIGPQREEVFDFALAVRQSPTSESLLGPLALEQEENISETNLSSPSPYPAHGVVQVGLTNRLMLLRLHNTIKNIILITLLIIGLGIFATTLLANRIVMPLRNLAELAKKVAQGEASALVTPMTHDEVGQLGLIFNYMTEAIRDRERAISEQVVTIKKQVNRLTTLSRTGTAIASHLDQETLLTTVLHLLVENVGFTHMVLMLYDKERNILCHAQTAGVPANIEGQAHQMEISVAPDNSLHADLVLEGRAFLIKDVSTIRHRIDPKLSSLIDQLSITSFVCAPLKSQQQVFGFIAADSTPNPSREEDLDLLMTIASTIGVAIANAKAYQQLEQLTVTLEQRVDERTRELQAANAQLRELDQIKSAFVSIVSHELRTPMTSIKGLVENMLDGLVGELTERQTFYLGRVHANVDRLTRMIHDLLDLSRIEAGKMELTTATFSISVLISEVTESLQSIAKDKGISLTVNQFTTLPTICGDRDKISQILTNLLHNALKFTPTGGEVAVRAQLKDDRFLQVCVSDTGCGIHESEQEMIFDRFYRSPSGPSDAGGAGLGLAITKNLVELHGGKIWVESIPGKGSDFFILMPIMGPLAPSKT